MEKSADKLQKFCRTVFLATVFLLPLKFGAMILPGVPHAYTADIYGVILNALPPSAFTVWSAALLILALAAYRFPAGITLKNPFGRVLTLFLLLPVITLLGFINPDNPESAVIEFEYILGVAAFAAASAIILQGSPENFRTRIFNTAAAGTIVTALAGAYQYFYGFDELKNFIATQEKLHNIKFPPELKARAYDVRTYGTFTFASALAGFLALTGALTAVRAFRWGGNFEPVKISQKIFAALAILLVAGIFLTTKGRSAFLAVIISAAFTGFILLKSRKVKLFLAISAVVVIIAGAFYIHLAGRGFGSMTERVGYLQSSVKMVLEHPFCGAGWGSFTYYHAQYKNFGNEELAKDPHNMIAAFASQTGIPGGVAITVLWLYILYLAGKRMKRDFSPENMALFAGLGAFSLHILMDLDWQVPALMAYYSLFALLTADDLSENETVPGRKLPVFMLAILSLLTLTGGIHYAASENTFGNMLAAAGQEAGAYTPPQSSYEVDIAAEKALKLAPYSASICNAMALDKLRRGDLDRAEELFRQTIKLAPRSHAAHKSLSKLYTLLGKKELAEKHAAEADRLFPYYKVFMNKRKHNDHE